MLLYAKKRLRVRVRVRVRVRLGLAAELASLLAIILPATVNPLLSPSGGLIYS